MPTVAILCEYNLFHSGHARLIAAVRARFGADTTVVSLMSGHFTQRGIPAATDKYTRAHAALLCGSDLTLEFPLPYCCSVAERFARGGVALAAALGGIDYLAFGSERGDIALLEQVSERRASAEFAADLAAALASAGADESYLRVRERAYAQRYGALALAPNDQLAVEYLTALRATYVRPALFERTGTESATAARSAFLSGDDRALSALVPQEALNLYRSAPRASEQYLSRVVLARLRAATPASVARCADVTDDLAHRIYRLAGECATLQEFYDRIPAKTYTRARVRRAVVSFLLGITDAQFADPPSYTLVLSANKRGCTLLSHLHKSAHIPIYMKGSQITDPIARAADALYTLALEQPTAAGAFLRKSPVIDTEL